MCSRGGAMIAAVPEGRPPAEDAAARFIVDIADCPYVTHYLARGPRILSHHTYHELGEAARQMHPRCRAWHVAAEAWADDEPCPYCQAGNAIAAPLRL